MGEPAVMSPKERADSRQLAKEIVDAVLEDECGPCDLPFAYRGRIPEDVHAWIIDNEERIFQLAHELQHLDEDLAISEGRQGTDGENAALRIALTEALDLADAGWTKAETTDQHQKRDRIDQLRDFDKPEIKSWIVVWKDRHTDDAISVHLSRAAADAKLDEYIAENTDEESLVVNVTTTRPPWVRSVICGDDGPRGHIEEALIR